MKIVLVRHLAADVAPGLCYGRLDVALSAEALRELPVLARSLAGYRAAQIWTSPARRCALLAREVAAHTAAPLRLDSRLRELDFGDWEGLPWDSLPRRALDRWSADPLDFAPPGGERGRDFLARVTNAWGDVVSAGEDCLVVSHGGPLRILSALAGGVAPDLLAPTPALGSVTVLTA